MSGIAASSHIDELEPLVAESLDGELHQGSAVTTTLVLRVHGDHFDHPQRLVLVLPENGETRHDPVGRGHNERFSAVRETVLSDASGLRCPPLRAVQKAEDGGSENVLERDEDRLPRSQRQVDDSFQIGRRQRPNPMRWRGGARPFGHASAPFHDDEADT
jgi:hypothetical protein